jgi:hypothetical protein
MRLLVKWLVGPLFLALLATGLGHARARAQQKRSLAAALSDSGQLELAPGLAMANVIWAFGSLESVKKMLRIELDRLPESEGRSRARVFVRFGLVDTNPDGQAAVFNQACAVDAVHACNDQLKEIAEREVRARFVAPGNALPLYFMPDHPHVPVLP